MKLKKWFIKIDGVFQMINHCQPWYVLAHDKIEALEKFKAECVGGTGEFYVFCDPEEKLAAMAPDMLRVIEQLYASARYWSEYEVPVGIVERMKKVLEAVNE
jgi:hypothetical protein